MRRPSGCTTNHSNHSTTPPPIERVKKAEVRERRMDAAASTELRAAMSAGLLPPCPRYCNHHPPPSTIFSARRSPSSFRSPSRPPPVTIRRRCTTRRRSGETSDGPSSTSTIGRSSGETSATMKLTYLEFNGWVWELDGGFRILVDPILVGNLDFGVPWLFDGAKKRLTATDDDPTGVVRDVDLLLITQSLDDHCHLRTLTKISARAPSIPVVTTPNARPIIAALPFQNVTYLEPGQSTAVVVDDNQVTVLATKGPVLGPPWQLPENGYIVTADAGRSLYYEPHCVYDASFLRDRGLRADVLVTPVVKQLLPADFTLVSGQEDAVELARILQPTYVVPMSNGEFNAKGLLTGMITTQGTTQTFEAMLEEALPQAQVLQPTPGVPLHIHFNSAVKTPS